jgi:hypothetical protein
LEAEGRTAVVVGIARQGRDIVCEEGERAGEGEIFISA